MSRPDTGRPGAAVEAEFVALYAEYRSLLTEVVRRRAPSADHEAAVAEAFAALWQTWATLTGNRRAWVTRVAINRAFSQLRRRQRLEAIMASGTGVAVSHVETPEDRLAWLAVQDALRGMRSFPAQALMLRHWAGHSDAEIARRRGCLPLTVRQEISRARGVLRRELTDR